ncbi:MAG: Gfo/Idh/MocA family oxidoreductase [Bifidobacteriaceae bacterium]|jgi:predicted dehydrogenase|nr:Gfo/Idh/MocA family oxidoreductase [Bifidobacteriaceae bacterium]
MSQAMSESMSESKTGRPHRYLVVGSGWRSGVYLRLGTGFPDRLRATGIVAETSAQAEEAGAKWGLPAGTSVEEAVKRDKPDFVCVLVPWKVAPVITGAVVRMGTPVMCETPPAEDLDGLKSVWADVGSSGLVQSSEQYLRYPSQVARLKIIESGQIGKVTAVHVSQSHLYHEVSVLRKFLGADMSPLTVTAHDVPVGLVEPQDYGLWSYDDAVKDLVNTFAHLGFDSGGFGTYDFTTRQWWNPLRVDRIVVNGSRGEILDDRVTYLQGNRRIVTDCLNRRHGGDEMTFEGRELDQISYAGQLLWTNDWLGRNLTDDDLALAAQLDAMGEWVAGNGPEPYPMAQACQDHAISLAIEESAAAQKSLRVEGLPWM